MKTNIAVIIPVFNGAKYLHCTLDSVFAQSRLPSEILVVDDGSQDESVKIAESYPQVKVLFNPRKGPGEARNFGFQKTTAPLVAFLDQDDIWQSEHLSILSQILEQNPEYSAVVAGVIQFYRQKRLNFPTCSVQTQKYNPWKHFPTNSIVAPSAVLIQRKALSSIGGWPTHIKGCTDIYTWLRLTANQDLIRSSCVTVGYRRHSASNSNKLRLEKIDNLVNEYYSIAESVIPYRIVENPQEKETLRKRLEALGQFKSIVKVLSSRNKEMLSECLENLNIALKGETQNFRESMCQSLIWFLYPCLTIDKNLMIDILTSYSHKNCETSQAMKKTLFSTRIFWQHFLRNPLDVRFWVIILQHNKYLQQAVSHKYKRWGLAQK